MEVGKAKEEEEEERWMRTFDTDVGDYFSNVGRKPRDGVEGGGQ